MTTASATAASDTPTPYFEGSPAAREFIERNDANALLDTGSLVLDERRKRPRYFDGRFLAARDLTREQTYFLTRQADLGRAGGSGVVARSGRVSR